MKRKSDFEMLVVLILGIIFESIFFVSWCVNFDQMIGDAGDARFNGVVLSIGGKCFKATQNGCLWLLLSIEGVLGYSDADFLFALPYSGLRFLDWIFLHLYK
jgi:hypothetical protein